jgi:hypothetical protein
MKRVSETKAGQSISAWVVLSPDGDYVAKVQAHFSASGNCTVNVFDQKADKVQTGNAGGAGYDKLTAALSGVTIDGHLLTSDCGVQSDKPDGLKYFPPEFVVPDGYSLANGGYVDVTTGKWVSRVVVRDPSGQFDHWVYLEADNNTMFATHVSEYDYQQNPKNYIEVDEKNVAYVYQNCYKTAGLNYLSRLGYKVYQAI